LEEKGCPLYPRGIRMQFPEQLAIAFLYFIVAYRLTYREAARLFKDVFDLNLTHPSFMAFI
jgi:hypothetical protein